MTMSEKEKKDANKKEVEEIEYEFVKKKKKKGWILPLVIVLLISAGLSYFFFLNDVELPVPVEEGEAKENGVDDDFLAGLRLVAMERYEEAISYFDKVRYNRLDASDKEILIHAYIMANEEQKALDLNPESDVKVIEKLYRFDELEKLFELDTDSELIEFEIAILEQDYEKVIDYKDVERLEIDERIANEISNAHYELGDKEEAVNFTSLMTFDDINVWSNEWTGTQRVETKTEVISKTSLLYTLLILLLLGLNLFSLFMQYRNGTLFQRMTVKASSVGKEEKEDVAPVNRRSDKKRKRGKRREKEKVEEVKDDDVEEKYSYHFDE